MWLLLLAGPIGARFMVGGESGAGVQIAVGRHLPVLTSAMLGVSLGIVVSTMLLPLAFLYLRSNVTRRQPWQLTEVTSASRVAVALGRFGADLVVLFSGLATLTVAGWFLGCLIVTGPLDLPRLTCSLWVIAAPTLMGVAALRRLFDALPPTRRGLGEMIFLVIWVCSIAMPASVADQPSSFVVNMHDFPGFTRPLNGPVPVKHRGFAIGSTSSLLPGRVSLDVWSGIRARGYLASRLAWAVIALMLAAASGLLYLPHTERRRSQMTMAAERLFSSKAAPEPVTNAPAAPFAAAPFLGLVAAEFRLIGRGRSFHLLAAAASVAGLFGDYRHLGSAFAFLLLAFGYAAHAGRSESTGLSLLHQSAPVSPLSRRLAFVLAGLGWSLLLALPATLVRASPMPLMLMGAVGGGGAVIATTLATLSRSSFAPRLVLLVLWYGYLSS